MRAIFNISKVPKNPFAEPDRQSKFNFGNPYSKQSKQKQMQIDETEEVGDGAHVHRPGCSRSRGADTDLPSAPLWRERL